MHVATLPYIVNHARPVEDLVGVNRFGVRRRLGNIHCMTSPLAARRALGLGSLRKMPPPLRRGLVKCLFETLNEYRATYLAVAAGAVMHNPND